tara:strand:- start:1335 stop:1559 length:225 start_codon:yes stop_codon:yes gene_type:complete
MNINIMETLISIHKELCEQEFTDLLQVKKDLGLSIDLLLKGHDLFDDLADIIKEHGSLENAPDLIGALDNISHS